MQCVGSSQKRLVVCGPKPGFEEHYGHLDILVSTHVLLVVEEYTSLAYRLYSYLVSALGHDMIILRLRAGRELTWQGCWLCGMMWYDRLEIA